MNTPFIQPGDVQQASPAGAVQSGKQGAAPVASSGEFALTFGDSLRQSEQGSSLQSAPDGRAQAGGGSLNTVADGQTALAKSITSPDPRTGRVPRLEPKEWNGSDAKANLDQKLRAEKGDRLKASDKGISVSAEIKSARSSGTRFASISQPGPNQPGPDKPGPNKTDQDRAGADKTVAPLYGDAMLSPVSMNSASLSFLPQGAALLPVASGDVRDRDTPDLKSTSAHILAGSGTGTDAIRGKAEGKVNSGTAPLVGATVAQPLNQSGVPGDLLPGPAATPSANAAEASATEKSLHDGINSAATPNEIAGPFISRTQRTTIVSGPAEQFSDPNVRASFDASAERFASVDSGRVDQGADLAGRVPASEGTAIQEGTVNAEPSSTINVSLEAGTSASSSGIELRRSAIASPSTLPNVAESGDDAGDPTRPSASSPSTAASSANGAASPAVSNKAIAPEQAVAPETAHSSSVLAAKPGQLGTPIVGLGAADVSKKAAVEGAPEDPVASKPSVPASTTSALAGKPLPDQTVEGPLFPHKVDADRSDASKTFLQDTRERVKPTDAKSSESYLRGAIPAAVLSESRGTNQAGPARPLDGAAPELGLVASTPASTNLAATSAQQTVAQAAPVVTAPHLVAGANAGSSFPAASNSTSTLETAHGLASGAGLPPEPFRTIAASPTTLEVGVPNGTQGWVRIRAEIGEQGAINASLAAASNSGQETLHRQLPALNEFLHGEQISATTSIANRVFAAGGSSLAGTAAGLGGAAPDASGRSFNDQGGTNQDASSRSAAHHGGSQDGGHQPDAGRALAAPAPITSPQSYDRMIGANYEVALRSPRDDESGRWLNVRA